MQSDGTLLLRRSDVARLVTLRECIEGVEKIFRWQGEGKVAAPAILGLRSPHGSLHIKAGLLGNDRSYLVAKLNTNFSDNTRQFGLPTIQGVIVLYDGENGYPLAVIDSIDITVKRTAAASAVAAKYLASPDSSIATICGCGTQGHAHLWALHTIFPLKKIQAFDTDEGRAKEFATALADELNLEIEPVRDLEDAIRKTDICVTCTPSRQFFVRKENVSPGTFIAAVGADDEHKQEIDPALLASSKVVPDNLAQCSTIGELHHAIRQGLMRKEDAYAELSEIVADRKRGRTTVEEIIIFDSTGIATEDAIVAATVYEKARAAMIGDYFKFAA